MCSEKRSFLPFLPWHLWIERERESRLAAVYFMLANYFQILSMVIILNIYWLLCLKSSKHFNVLLHVIFTPSLSERCFYYYPCLLDSKAQRLGYSPKIKRVSPRFQSQCVQSFTFSSPNQVYLFFNHECRWLFLFVCFCFSHSLDLDQEQYYLIKYRQA